MISLLWASIIISSEAMYQFLKARVHYIEIKSTFQKVYNDMSHSYSNIVFFTSLANSDYIFVFPLHDIAPLRHEKILSHITQH